jgi:hypothetical protein
MYVKRLLAGMIQSDQVGLLDLLAQGFVVRRLQIHGGYARGSLLALRKNLQRGPILPNRIMPA